MANNISPTTQNNLFASMLLQLQNQAKQLEQANITLAQKDQLIESLEVDLEHMVEHLSKLQPGNDASSNQWINRPVPGLN